MTYHGVPCSCISSTIALRSGRTPRRLHSGHTTARPVEGPSGLRMARAFRFVMPGRQLTGVRPQPRRPSCPCGPDTGCSSGRASERSIPHSETPEQDQHRFDSLSRRCSRSAHIPDTRTGYAPSRTGSACRARRGWDRPSGRGWCSSTRASPRSSKAVTSRRAYPPLPTAERGRPVLNEPRAARRASERRAQAGD